MNKNERARKNESDRTNDEERTRKNEGEMNKADKRRRIIYRNEKGIKEDIPSKKTKL